jgi:hypothetical protein
MGIGSQSIESMTMTLVKLSSGKPRSTLRGQRKAFLLGESVQSYLRIVSVWSLKALLILAFFSAWKPSGLRYAGQEAREYRPWRQR